MALNPTDSTNEEKTQTKLNHQDESLNDTLEAISKSGSSKNFAKGNRSFTTLLSKKSKENTSVVDKISTNDLQDVITFNQEEDVLSEERLEKISTSSLMNLQKSSINDGHQTFSNLLQRTGAAGRGQQSPVKSLIEHQQKPSNNHNVKHQEPFAENNVSKHATSTYDKNDREDDIEKLVSEMAAMSKIEKSLAAKMEKLHTIFSLENTKFGVDHQNNKQSIDHQEMAVEAIHIEFNQLRGKLKTFEKLLEEKSGYQDIVSNSKESIIKKTLETRIEPILQKNDDIVDYHKVPNNQNIVSQNLPNLEKSY